MNIEHFFSFNPPPPPVMFSRVCPYLFSRVVCIRSFPSDDFFFFYYCCSVCPAELIKTDVIIIIIMGPCQLRWGPDVANELTDIKEREKKKNRTKTKLIRTIPDEKSRIYFITLSAVAAAVAATATMTTTVERTILLNLTTLRPPTNRNTFRIGRRAYLRPDTTRLSGGGGGHATEYY